MDSQSIGSVTSAGKTAPVQAHAQTTTKPQATQSSETARQQQREQVAEAARATEMTVPQRDPRSLKYQVDGATHRVVATIIDDGSKTVVRQIPDAEILRIAQAIDRMQGFLVEEKA